MEEVPKLSLVERITRGEILPDVAALIQRTTDNHVLLAIAKSKHDGKDRYLAAGKIKDDALLFALAKDHTDKKISLIAVEQINSQRMILQLVKDKDVDPEVAYAAIKKVTNQLNLSEIAEFDERAEMRSVALSLIDDEMVKKGLLSRLMRKKFDIEVEYNPNDKEGMLKQLAITSNVRSCASILRDFRDDAFSEDVALAILSNPHINFDVDGSKGALIDNLFFAIKNPDQLKLIAHEHRSAWVRSVAERKASKLEKSSSETTGYIVKGVLVFLGFLAIALFVRFQFPYVDKGFYAKPSIIGRTCAVFTLVGPVILFFSGPFIRNKLPKLVNYDTHSPIIHGALWAFSIVLLLSIAAYLLLVIRAIGKYPHSKLRVIALGLPFCVTLFVGYLWKDILF